MLIGLISDTHIPDNAKGLPDQLETVFGSVDCILHAGDIYVPWVLDELELLAPVLAAWGDDDEGFATDWRVKKKHILTIDGTTIWLIHERPWWTGLLGSKEAPQHERAPDVIVCGHSHCPTLEEKEGVLVVNPGSPTLPLWRRELGTVGLLTVNSGKAEAQIIQL